MERLHNIGIALSGGGIRATIFHLGLFKWLAEHNCFEEVRKISSVSGASLCVGMIYAHNNLAWPTSEEFLTTVLPSIEKVLLSTDLQKSALVKLVISPQFWGKKVNVVAKTMESIWGVSGNLSQLTDDVKWYINCTTYESGKRFRFCKENMGDYSIGYVNKPDIALSEVMAASAGFPGLIGPYSLKTNLYQWMPSEYSGSDWNAPNGEILHLWDGGVYDNLGLESIFKMRDEGELSKGLDFMMVSNASPSIGFHSRKSSLSVYNLRRMLEISMDQVAALRSRAVMDFIERTGQGMYLKIGNSAEKITQQSKCSPEIEAELVKQSLSPEQAERAMNYPTTLSKPAEADFQLLLQHGYEVANCTYQSYSNPDAEA